MRLFVHYLPYFLMYRRIVLPYLIRLFRRASRALPSAASVSLSLGVFLTILFDPQKQIRSLYIDHGAAALQSNRRGPKTNFRRTSELVCQVIRQRFLDPDASPDVIAQKLRQAGFVISTRSVYRVIAQFGLPKKPLSLPS
jgi:hypothetical protein